MEIFWIAVGLFLLIVLGLCWRYDQRMKAQGRSLRHASDALGRLQPAAGRAGRQGPGRVVAHRNPVPDRATVRARRQAGPQIAPLRRPAADPLCRP